MNIVFLPADSAEAAAEAGGGEVRVVVSGPAAGDTAMWRLDPGEPRLKLRAADGVTGDTRLKVVWGWVEQGMESTGGNTCACADTCPAPPDVSTTADSGTFTVLTVAAGWRMLATRVSACSG